MYDIDSSYNIVDAHVDSNQTPSFTAKPRVKFVNITWQPYNELSHVSDSYESGSDKTEVETKQLFTWPCMLDLGFQLKEERSR